MKLNYKKALELYRKMALIRLCEEKIGEEYFQDEMKTPVHLSIGEEAIPVGVLDALPISTQVYGTYRSHALYLAKTEDIDGFFGELYGKSTGACKGKAGSMHLMKPESGVMVTSAVVGTSIPVAVGAAMANKYKGKNEWVATFFGDGAIEEGVFWESLNFACLHNLKILFVLENNELAIHSLPHTRRGYKLPDVFKDRYDAAYEYGSGEDLEEVVDLTQKIFEKMKSQNSPGILQLDYFRFLEHVGPLEDFKFGYRQPPEDHKTQKDPLWNFRQNYSELADDFAKIEKELKSLIAESVRKAQLAPFPKPEELYTDVLVENDCTGFKSNQERALNDVHHI